MKSLWVLIVMIAFPVLCRGVGPLDPYLLRPGDLPVVCQSTSGFYPINEKTDLFYQYKAYRSVLPPAIERHAQSFDCAGQKGTIYFFAYAAADQAQAAELFAKPVVTQSPPAPLVRDWPTGFEIVSFVDPPKDLMAALEAKLNSENKLPTAAAAQIVFVSTVTEPRVVTSSAPIQEPAPVAEVVAVSSATVTMPTTGQVAIGDQHGQAVPAPEAPVVPGPDLSDAVIKNLIEKVPCRGNDASDEGKPLCTLLHEFLHGDAPQATIPPNQPLMGIIYWLDKDGGFSGPAYQAGIGSGHPNEVALMPVIPVNGVEDFEAQALVENRRNHHPWPTNELTDRIAAHARPDQATAFPTKGRSLVMLMKEERKIFVRQTKKAWILIGISGITSEEQMQSDSTIAVLY